METVLKEKIPQAAERNAEHAVMDMALRAGRLLLENGAEIFRVEETMERICRHYRVENASFFVLSNGIFITGASGYYARVEHIPVKGAQLDRVTAINQLSREIEQGLYSVEQACARLEEIERMPRKKFLHQVLASGVGSACFCFLFGGSWSDSAVSFVAGVLLYAAVLKLLQPKMSRIIGNIIGGMLVSAVCVLFYSAGAGRSLSHMIIGSIIPLVPGVPFTNGIRDLADGDYISGSVRLLDAILSFLCIAIGVGVVISFYHELSGGGLA